MSNIIQTFPRSAGSGGGGTSDYTDLENKPQIAGVTLSGNKSLADLGIQPSEQGKGLSTNDYTTADKNAVATIGDKMTGTKASDADVQAIKDEFHPQANGVNVNITPYQIYDGTERVVGTWFGKPLYCKGLNRVSSSDPTQEGNLSIIETNTTYRFVYAWGKITSTKGATVGIPYGIPTPGEGITPFQDSDNKIKIYWPNSGIHAYWGGTYWIMLFYTKTTD